MQEIKNAMKADALAARKALDFERLQNGHREMLVKREAPPDIAGNRKQRRAARALAKA